MALGGVFMGRTNGNIGTEVSMDTDKVSGLLLDISGQPDFFTKDGLTLAANFKDAIVEFTGMSDVNEKFGLDNTSESGDVTLSGVCAVAYYHIKHFFGLVGEGARLFVMFADCSQSWSALIDMQKAAVGMINQFGVWTEQHLWTKMDSSASQYGVALVADLQAVAVDMANNYYAPASILLCANTAQVKTASGTDNTVVFSEIPSCVIGANYISVLLGQDIHPDVSKIQSGLTSKTPVGLAGAALGLLAKLNVANSIGWVQECNICGYVPNIEFGFGNVEVVDNALVNTTKFSSLSKSQLDRLEELGYIFLVKYAGLESGVYFSGDSTCANDDYRTISRNRVINKSCRAVRTVLLPYVNSPIKVDPATGQLSAAQITIFKNRIADILNRMVTANEISGVGQINIPAAQNILQNDQLNIQYSVVPIGCAHEINVQTGFALKQ